MTTVANIYHQAFSSADCVLIGRPTKWGNPFVIGVDGNRKKVIEEHRKWLLKQPHLLAQLHELKNKRLLCYCAPKPCHGDTLAHFADNHFDVLA